MTTIEAERVATAPASATAPFRYDTLVEAPTLHVGAQDLPFVTIAAGVELQLLHVDLSSGLWVNRTRLQPGARVPTHLHAGTVYAVTLSGSWYYLETPDQVNTAGSYLFEPAGSVHTLVASADHAGPTLAWFAINGPNINVDGDGAVTGIFDARTILNLYRGLVDKQGGDYGALIVRGE